MKNVSSTMDIKDGKQDMAMSHKLVALVNSDLEIGLAMNALAHTALSMGILLGEKNGFLQKYSDASDNQWKISGMSYVILRAKSNEIKKVILKAKEMEIKSITFVDSMTGGGYQEQIENMSLKTQDEHRYHAATLFGTREDLSILTKSFSLYR